MLKRNIILFLRLLQRQKSYYLISISGLALGLAAFVMLALYVNYESSYDSFHANTERLYRVSASSARTPVPLGPTIEREVSGVVRTTRLIFASSGSRFILHDGSGNVFEEDGYFVDSTFFDLFSYTFIGEPIRKPLVNPDEVVITKRLAEKYFPGQAALGKTLEFGNGYLRTKLYKVAGVIENPPSHSQFSFDLLLPFSQYGAANNSNWTQNIVYSFLLLEPRANPEEVFSAVKKIFSNEALMSEAETNEIMFQPFQKLHFENRSSFDFGSHNKVENLIILSSVAVLILLIAIINFVNLTTAHAAERRKEVGLRKVAGADRAQLFRQFLLESISVACLSFLISLFLVYISAPGFDAIAGINFNAALDVGKRFVWFFPLFPLVIGFMAGFYPSSVISGFAPMSAFRGQVPQKNKLSLRSTLVVVQFIITGFLIISTMIISQQMEFVRQKDLGFDKDQIVILNVGGPGIGEKIHTLRQEFKQNPNIVNVSGALTLPGDLTYTMPYSIYDQLGHDDTDHDLAGFYVDHEFVANLGIEVVEGRNFSPELSTDTLNFLLNEEAVKKLSAKYGEEWRHPVGKKLNYFRSDDNGWYVAKEGTVIGVVKNFNFVSLHKSIDPLAIQVDYKLLYKLLVKVRPEHMSATIEFMKTKWSDLGIQRPFNFQFLDDQFARAYEKDEKFGSLFKIFCTLSIIISCVGLYGLVLYTTDRRSKEISIRKVLGARTSGLIMLLGKDYLKPVVVAFAIVCVPTAYLMSQWLEQFAYREEISIVVFVQAAFVCLAVAFLTLFFRTYKVSNANPARYLREN